VPRTASTTAPSTRRRTWRTSPAQSSWQDCRRSSSHLPAPPLRLHRPGQGHPDHRGLPLARPQELLVEKRSVLRKGSAGPAGYASSVGSGNMQISTPGRPRRCFLPPGLAARRARGPRRVVGHWDGEVAPAVGRVDEDHLVGVDGVGVCGRAQLPMCRRWTLDGPIRVVSRLSRVFDGAAVLRPWAHVVSR